MRLLKRRSSKPEPVAAAPAAPASREGFDGDDAALAQEIERLVATPDPGSQRRLLWLRHLAGIRMLEAAPGGARHAEPDADALPEADGLPEIAAADVTPELLRAGILRDGCVLVRGLVDRDAALELAAMIDRGFAERAALEGGGERRRRLLRGVPSRSRRSSRTSAGTGSRPAAACSPRTRPR